MDAHQEALLLLLVGDREPVFEQQDPRPHEHALEVGHIPEERLDLVGRREPHDPLDAGPVVPGAVEQHDFARRRQVRHVALEIPLAPLSLGGRRQGDDPTDPGVEALRDALDGAALPRRVAPLEDHDDLRLGVRDPGLQLDQLCLQLEEVTEVLGATHGRPGLRPLLSLVDLPISSDSGVSESSSS